jgi:type VI secretion system secreted protein Hcp
MKKLLFVFLFMLVAALPGLCAAALFMFVSDIPGDSRDSNHTNWIDVEGFSHEISMEEGTSANHGALVVTCILDKSAPILNVNACSASVIPSVFLKATSDTDTSKAIYVIELLNAHVEGITTVASAGQPARFTVRLKYDAIGWTYTLYDSNGNSIGSVSAGWSVVMDRYYP